MPTLDCVKTGENIAKMREARNISVKMLQDMFGFGSANTIYKWQRGESMPTIDNFVVLADIFGTTIDKIIVKRIV